MNNRNCWKEMTKDKDNGELSPLALACSALIDFGCDCGNDEPGACIACRCEAGLRYLFAKLPDHPAIPEEVRETIRWALRKQNPKEDDYTSRLNYEKAVYEVEAARDWLAKCPPAAKATG